MVEEVYEENEEGGEEELDRRDGERVQEEPDEGERGRRHG